MLAFSEAVWIGLSGSARCGPSPVNETVRY